MQDYDEAMRWYRKSADQGDCSAQFAIGRLYDQGAGVPVSHPVAAEWYLKSAKRGCNMAQYSLGQMYENGEGVSKDYVIAYMWYNVAAPMGADAVVVARNRVSQLMTREQIAEAQRLSRDR